MKIKVFGEKAYNSILESIANINIWTGAVRSSKTIASIVRLIELSQSNRVDKDIKGVLVGKTIGSLEKNILEVIEDLVGKKNYKYSRTKNQVLLFGRKFDVVGAKDESSYKVIQGATYGIGYCDEVALYPKNFWDMLQSRFISVLNYIILATCNPESPFHWLKTDYIDKAIELAIKIFHFTLDDNPHLPDENKESLKAKFSGVFYERFILGLWVLAQGLIYPMFDKNIHLFDDLQLNYNDVFHVSIDYGAKNPFAMGLYVDKPKTTDLRIDNKIKGLFNSYMIKEYYYSGKEKDTVKTNEEYTSDLVDFVGNRKIGKIFCDPSAIAFINTVKKTYPKLGAKFVKTDNSVKEGIETVASMLGQKRLFIHKNCKKTQMEFNVYSWNEKKAMKTGVEEPIKENDHSMDQIRYFAHNHMISVDRLKGWTA